MSIQDFSPLWESWHIGEVIGRGTYGTVYRIYKKEFDKTYYSAVKHISIPDSKQDTENLYAEGITTGDSIKSYYEQIMINLRNEIETNYALKGNSHIVSYEDHKIIPKKDGVGYDIFIRMELLTSLSSVLKNRFLTADEVVKLGIDLCGALETLEQKKIIHRDIKPGNLFVSDSGNYKLGDFGVARELTKTVSGMSVKGTFKYMAPEIQRGGNVNFTADIYSLGIVMYHLLNFNRAPFLPAHPNPISYEDNERSVQLRMSGQALPMPANADTALASIVLKACEYYPERRWQSARAFKVALEEYIKIKKSGGITNSKTPPYRVENYANTVKFSEHNNAVPTDQQTTVALHGYPTSNPEPVGYFNNGNFSPQKNENNIKEAQSSNKTITVLIVLLTVCITLIVTIGGCFIYFYSDTETTTKPISSSETIPQEITDPETEPEPEPDPEIIYGNWEGEKYLYTNTYEAQVVTEKDPLMLRDGPSTTDDIIGKIPRGQYVTVLGANTDNINSNTGVPIININTDWLYVEYNGKKGWASARYLYLYW